MYTCIHKYKVLPVAIWLLLWNIIFVNTCIATWIHKDSVFHVAIWLTIIVHVKEQEADKYAKYISHI